MKTIIVFAVLIAGIAGFPNFGTQIDLNNERLVTNQIENAIKDAIQAIQDAGLDPLYIDRQSFSAALPVPVIFSSEAEVKQFRFAGLSNIVINNLSFSILTYRLTFDISLPRIQTELESALLEVIFFGEHYRSFVSGRFAVNNIRLNGNVRVSVGIISGISLRSLDINFRLGGIESYMNIRVQNWDLSRWFNTYFGFTIPNTLNRFAPEINELIEIIAVRVIESIL